MTATTKEAITLDKFKTAIADEYGEALGLTWLRPGTAGYTYETDEYYFTIGFSNAEGEWVCEVEDDEGCMFASWYANTPEEALEGAAVDVCSIDALEGNDNCEDAVNDMAYRAYALLNAGAKPETDDELQQLDRMLGVARHIVAKHGYAYGIDWVDY